LTVLIYHDIYLYIENERKLEMPLTKKAMVLFEPEKYRQLKEIARKEHISVGEIIRKTIDEMVLKRSTEDERLEAAKRLTAPQEDLTGTDRDVVSHIAKRSTNRDERLNVKSNE
jgi:hypothetical protein